MSLYIADRLIHGFSDLGSVSIRQSVDGSNGNVRGVSFPLMDRRSLLKLSGMAAVGFGVEACAPKTNAQPQVNVPRRPKTIVHNFGHGGSGMSLS